jgi:nicotinamidase-related amidase
MQHDFCSEGGLMHETGHDLSSVRAAAEQLRHVLDRARAAGVLPVHIQARSLPKHASSSGPWLLFMVVRYGMDPERGCTVEGTWGAEIIDEVAPRPGEIVVTKARSSAFVGTTLDMVLRCHGIKTVVVTGVVTQGCVESTARDAMYHDYYTVVLEDCVATYDRGLHEAALKVLASRMDVVPSEHVLKLWAEGPPPAA